MFSDIDMLVLLLPNLVQLQLGSSDPEERCLLVKVAEIVVKVGDEGGDKAEVDAQESINGGVLDYFRDEEHRCRYRELCGK